MKLKGVNPVEQHIEKIVLVAVSAIFLVVVAAQFLFEPNMVTVGKNQAVMPGEAFRASEERASHLKRDVIEATDLPLPTVPASDLVDQFKGRLQGAVAPRPTLASAIGKPSNIGSGSAAIPGKAGTQRINPLTVPAPMKVVAASIANTIDPTEPINIPELKKLLPAEQPLDKKSVSVEARFDGTALAAALKTDGGSNGDAIPLGWYRDSLELVQVSLERQEQTGPDSWSDAAPVAAAPGRASLAEQLKTVKASSDLVDVAAEAQAQADDLLRPPFYGTICGAKWAPPSAAAVAISKTDKDAKSSEVGRHVKNYDDATKQLDLQKKKRTEVEATPVRDARNGGEGRGGGGGGGGKGGGPIQPNAPQVKPIPQAEKDAQLKAIDNRIKDLETRQKTEEDALKALGLDTAGHPLAPGAMAGSPATGTAERTQPKALLENPDIQMWAHDLTVEPGKVYRYRVKVALTNPFFARTSALVPEQQELAKSPIIVSQASEWSEPVRVLDDQYYFITNAAESDAMGGARATAELYKFFYGYYRKGSISLEPGDVLAAAIKLPDPAKLPIYDVTQPATPATPGVPPPIPGRDGRKGAPGEVAIPKGQAPQQSPEQAKATLPPNAKPYPKTSISAASDTVLLDVAKGARGDGGGPAQPEALLRSADGSIVIRVPEDDRKTAVYTQVVQSAKDGETQGQPTAPVEKKDTPKPQTIPKPTNIRPNPPPPGGGGGGGGAGGGL
jgi:hypothetical protein